MNNPGEGPHYPNVAFFSGCLTLWDSVWEASYFPSIWDRLQPQDTVSASLNQQIRPRPSVLNLFPARHIPYNVLQHVTFVLPR
jgi:hypothetical protein